MQANGTVDVAHGAQGVSPADGGRRGHDGSFVQAGDSLMTLSSAVLATLGLNLQETNVFIARGICKQLYKRWREFLKLHPEHEHISEPGMSGQGTRPMPALPEDIVQQFIADNIDWAKRKVQARIDRIFWGRSDVATTSSVDAQSDDEYDADADV